ncbi:MAG: hypothetical protein FWG70_07370 [Oscillospiraceae bacterium]|nr:hypothetical protein [Oscillospiraceae bacterium]
MKFTTILIGGALLVGLGVYLSKKFNAKNTDEDAVVYAEEKETYGEKLHKASMFAVGAIKTSTDKIVEGFKDMKNQDMVKKGEITIDHAKEAAGGFVGDLKEKVSIFSRNKEAVIDDENIDDESDSFFEADSHDEDL